MKKTALTLCSCAMLALLGTGCAYTEVRQGFPTPFGGGLYSDMSTAAMVTPAQDDDFKVVKRNVQAKSNLVSIFTIVNMGDASYQSLKAQALAQAPGATDLIDVNVDYKQKCILGINTIEITLTGTAVKY